jgi:tetratricopeptide (TPR) repeat protein
LARFDEAVALLEKALENNPRDAKTLTDLAETLIWARRYAEAVEASRLALSIDPLYSFAAVREAEAHRRWKGADGLADARDALDRVRADHQSSLANHHRLKQLFYESREEDVLEFVKGLGEFVRASESTYPSSLMRALALERLGQTEEARAAYREAVASLEQELERTPDNFRLYGPLGYAYAALGRPAEALAAAERGHEMLPLERDALRGADRLWELAAVNARLGNAETAIEQYRTLIEFTGAFSVPLLEIDFYMDPVRDHPKYKELVRDLG